MVSFVHRKILCLAACLLITEMCATSVRAADVCDHNDRLYWGFADIL